MISPTIQKGTLDQGFVSIATYTGLDPLGTVYANCLITDVTQHPADAHIADTDGLDRRSMQYCVLLASKNTNVLTHGMGAQHTDYLNRYVTQGNVINMPAKSVQYDDISILAQLEKELQDHTSAIIPQLTNKILVNSYYTHQFAHLCKQMHSHVLVDPFVYMKFLSKTYVHQVAKKIGLNVAPAVVFENPADVTSFHTRISRLKEVAGTPKTNIWIKAAAFSGGQGIERIADASRATLQPTLGRVAQAYRDAGFFANKDDVTQDKNNPFGDIQNFMPIIAELDISSLPGVKKVVANIGIQGVMSHDNITLVGAALQLTKNGEYIGALLPSKKDQPAIEVAEQEAAKLFAQMIADGYRGYAGIDVIVAEMDDGKLQGYVLETNPRLTSATPILSFTQQIQSITGKQPAGMTATYTIDAPGGTVEDKVAAMYDLLGDDLYRADETQYTGAVPYMLDPHLPDQLLFRVAIIDENGEDVQARQQRIANKVLALSPC